MTKIKLLVVPYDHRNPNLPNYGTVMSTMQFPPLGISTLKAFLQERNFSVDQDDLDIKVLDHNLNNRDRPEKQINMNVFSDEQRVRQLIEHGQEDTLELLGERILSLTDVSGYDVIGLSVVKPDNYSTIGIPIVLGKLIKERYGSTVIMGGATAPGPEKEVLSTGFVDYGIIGNCTTSIGEYNAFYFLDAFERGADLKAVPGVKYFDGKTVKWNWKNYSREERCTITTPDFDGLPLDLHRKPVPITVGDERGSFSGLVLTYYFMRGCPHRCTFCNLSVEKQWAVKDPELIANELKEFSRKYNTKYFLFHNPLMNPTYEFAERLADELIKQDVNILWTECAVFTPFDRPLLEKVREAGAVRLIFGFESASPQVLSFVQKPFRIDQAVKTLKNAWEAGIWTELDLICGFPYEGDADTDATLRFLKEHEKHIMSCHLNKFWMDGRIRDNPEHFGISIIEDHPTTFNWSSTSFKETYGMDWKDRLALNIRTYDRLRSLIDRLFVHPPNPKEIFH